MNTSFRNINKDVKEVLDRCPEPAFDGTEKEGWYRRYTVINERDAFRYLSSEEMDSFKEIIDYYLGKIEEGRLREDKDPFNNYLVINMDEEYAPEVIELLKRHGHWGK